VSEQLIEDLARRDAGSHGVERGCKFILTLLVQLRALTANVVIARNAASTKYRLIFVFGVVVFLPRAMASPFSPRNFAHHPGIYS
jgi:hypothetical protein